MDITKKIKSYEDACEALNLDPQNLPIVNNLPDIDQKSMIAYFKLVIIIRALNEGWAPNWYDYNQRKYFNYFYGGVNSGSFVSSANSAASAANANSGSRLCFKSRTLAEYAAEQFEDLYIDYLS